jgi:hypothetical protein
MALALKDTPKKMLNDGNEMILSEDREPLALHAQVRGV